MKRWVSKLPIPQVEKWRFREEILRQHAAQRELIHLLQLKSELEKIKHEYFALKYDPNQPRVPAGNPDGGQWTYVGGGEGETDEVKRILAQAKKLAARRSRLNECIELCYPLLERFQPPGSDRNEFDFRKCLDRCLGRN